MPAGTSRLVRGAGLVRQGVMAAAAFVTGMCKFTLGAPWLILGLAFLEIFAPRLVVLRVASEVWKQDRSTSGCCVCSTDGRCSLT
jgi:hypothetical protein